MYPLVLRVTKHTTSRAQSYRTLILPSHVQSYQTSAFSCSELPHIYPLMFRVTEHLPSHVQSYRNLLSCVQGYRISALSRSVHFLRVFKKTSTAHMVLVVFKVNEKRKQKRSHGLIQETKSNKIDALISCTFWQKMLKGSCKHQGV